MKNINLNRRNFLKKLSAGLTSFVVSQSFIQKINAEEANPSTPPGFYNEKYRPQFHFTPKTNWMNDPNGMVYYKGEYHLFFQHNPNGINWGDMTWGHAVSKDLVRWQQLANAIVPDDLGTIFSGSAVVDWKNTAGFQKEKEKAIVAIYTSAGDFAPVKKPFTQSIAYSIDCGRTWKKYEGNPVLGHLAEQNRDPKVIWHEPSQSWVMALYLKGNDYALFSSKNLKEWSHLCDINLPGASECPDFFELSVDGSRKIKKWVFWGANSSYIIGTFDGKKFIKESDILTADRGSNFYAAQTFSDIPESDGRRIQMAWMRDGSFPNMPFNQQLSFPCELTLRNFTEGIRMCRKPVEEISKIHKNKFRLKNKILRKGDNLLSNITGELFDIRAEFELIDAAEFGFRIRGKTAGYNAETKEIFSLGKSAPLSPVSNRITIQMLVDRTSIETFANEGKVSMSSCFLPETKDMPLETYCTSGSVNIISLEIYQLKSIWNNTEA